MAVQPLSPAILVFGPFELDCVGGELRRNGVRVRLSGQPFRILLVLVAHPGELVSREQLREEIWTKEAFVDFEHGLNAAVNKLRRALGDAAENPRYIETQPGRGYRFIGTIETQRSAPDPFVVKSPIHENPPAKRKVRLWWWLAGAGAGLALIVLSRLMVWSLVGRGSPPGPKLTDKSTVVLADFSNATGDPIFDGTLRQGLTIQLEQSPFLKIMDDEEMQRVLSLMSLPANTRITHAIAHEICIREGATATIDGAIASLGKTYVITLQAVTCHDGAAIAREQIQAEDKEHVLKALGTVGTAIRGKVGEPHNSIEKLSRPLEQVTTSSLEALQSYTAGHSEIEQGDFLASVPLFQRAIAIDPNFAMAYHFLSIAFENAGEGDILRTRQRAREYEQQAFGLIDRVSEFERSYIAARYYAQSDELDKAIAAYQLAIRNYPRFWGFHNYLSMAYIDTGRYEEGLREALEAARLQPDTEHPYRRQLDAYICLDNLSEAKRLAQKLRTEGLDGPRIHQRFLQMAYVEGDPAAIARETQWFAGKPEEYISFALQAADRDVHGQRRESRKLYQRAAETALREGLQDTASYFEEADAQADALAGNCRTVRRLGNPALAMALCGDASGAESFAAQASKLFPNGTVWNAVRLPEIQAAIALCRDQPARSVELLASAAPYERSYLDVVYVRGLAYLRMHKGAEAAAEFEKIVDHKGANWYERIHPPAQFYSLSYLGMARGFALAGATAKAKKAFQDFFELWKAADPDLPTLRQARAEYATLKRETARDESTRSAITSIAQQAKAESAR